MNADVFLFKYRVFVEYLGTADFPFRKGNRVEGVLAFNFDIGAIRLSVSLPGEPLEFTYPDWNSFEQEWSVLERS